MGDEQPNAQPPATDPLAEVTAMQKLAQAVMGLDADATARVLRWAIDRYNVKAPSHAAAAKTMVPNLSENGNGGGANATAQFADLAELYAGASPESEADKALVVGYWLQFGEGRTEFASQEVNSSLKNLGHPVKNITSAFEVLKSRKPSLVMQLKKSGTSRQARKTFKLTLAGKAAVENMIGQPR